MKYYTQFLLNSLLLTGFWLLFLPLHAQSEFDKLTFSPLFNGKNLDGWVNVNTAEDTWKVKKGVLISTGKPIGVMRTDRQYENFILEIEWKHMEAGGNSGVFVWSEGTPFENDPLTKAIEVQMLELEWASQHNQTDAYVHGELFPTMGMKAIPDNPRGTRSKSLEKRCRGKGQWNKYVVVCVDGTVKLSVNGKFVNGLRESERKKGYICLEAEGSEIHFRNIRILELPGGITTPEQVAPVVN
ncbi:3-keto-disaccharide hydrolase [Arundinibacter roseus]|uniref:DUF1080 domain-containing protein n=1 Tax=Arundinibacter roseus TaxID=2070510 RepID=A0A4R4K7W9_9BACT|nr:DUF1080 domain-containing protein [Arundinibacter roseus]TDB62269.1 DUF1080 domain-containing protein [Arundinibacter roseus]